METNNLVEQFGSYNAYGEQVARAIKGQPVCWTDPRLKEIVRLRLLSDPSFPAWDVSYCHGQLDDGSYVDVDLPFSQLPKGRKINAQIVMWAKKDKVYAKGLGIFDAISCLS
jgi:hypothetical protein